MNDLPDTAADPLFDADPARWDVAGQAVAGLADAAAACPLNGDAAAGALTEIRELPLDIERIVDAVDVPDDAGEHAAGLEAILRRIPPRWGRSISCAKGWYPILVELDEAIAAVIPNYEVHQVKEKFGGLRYYIGQPSEPWPCCTTFSAEHPRPDVSVRALTKILDSGRELTVDGQADWDRMVAWRELELAHTTTVEHQARVAAAQAAGDAVQALIRAAELRCAATCELCGQPGGLTTRGMWYQTLCRACAAADGADQVGDDADDEDSADGHRR